ncbi:MAG: hypothetical protein H5U40_16500, partial [Polyangiaceae bacterium]|nr:hypothetical protein [Polyangiaceae bacterium]
VRFPETAEGLVRIVVPPAVAARVDASRQDLRLVDGDDRQWAYLIGFEPHEQTEPLRLERTSPRARTSRYELSLAEGPLDVKELTLRVRAGYIGRRFRLFAPTRGSEGEVRLLGEGHLGRRPGERDILRIPVNERVERLVLEVIDGDDAPLELEASALVRLPVLYAAAPSGAYRLVFGVPASAEDVEPPSYEIEGARDLVLTVHAVEARVGEVEPNAAYAPPSPYSSSRMRDLALWGILGLAVLLLGALTFRLALAHGEPPPPASS